MVKLTSSASGLFLLSNLLYLAIVMALFIRLYFALWLLTASSSLWAQTRVPGSQHEVSAGLSLPVSNFNETHIIAAGAQYSITNHRFGINQPKTMVGWIGTVGVDYYIGKKDKAAGHSFRNGNYLHTRILGGIIGNPAKQVQVSLQTGAGWGVYQGTHALNFCSLLSGTYYLDEQWGIGAKLIMIKEKGARVLWAPGISISRTL